MLSKEEQEIQNEINKTLGVNENEKSNEKRSRSKSNDERQKGSDTWSGEKSTYEESESRKSSEGAENQSNEAQENEIDYSDFEKEQIRKGWNPKGRKTAEEWAEGEPLHENIKQLARENKLLKKTIDQVKEMMEARTTKEKQEEAAKLEDLRIKAIKAGDVSIVNQVEQQLNQQKQVNSIPEDILAFQDKYSDIFNKDGFEEIEIRDYVFKVDQMLGKKYSPKEHVAKLEELMQKKFPNYFDTNLNENLTHGIISGTNSNVSTRGKRKFTKADLDHDQREVFNEMQKHKYPITLEQYIQHLVDTGVLK